MNNGLSGIKNIIWAFAIVVALAAVLVGLIITMVLGFGGQRQDGTLYLGEGSGLSSGGSAGHSTGSSGVDGGLDTGAMALPGSQDTGLEYLFNLTFLCDDSFAAVGSFGLRQHRFRPGMAARRGQPPRRRRRRHQDHLPQ